MKKKVDSIQKPPELLAVIFLYCCALGMLYLFLPSIIFYFTNLETQGTVIELKAKTATIEFSNRKGDKLTKSISIKYKDDVSINDKVQLFFQKTNPKNILVPRLQGSPMYLIHFILLAVAIYASVSMHLDYSKYVKATLERIDKEHR